MLAGIQAGLEEIKKYETKANLDEQATALDVSFNRAIIKDFLNALDEYINQSSKSSLEEPNFDVINELGLQLHFSNKIVRQEIIDKLYPGARKIPDDSLIKSVLDRVSNEFPDDLTNIDLSQIELLSEISKKITGEPVKYILNYFIIYHLALKITSLGSADQVLGIINKLFTAKSFKESGLAPYLKGPLDKLDKKVFEANERAQEERHRIKSKLPEKIEISTRAFISAIESALSKIINETKEQAILEKLPEIKDAYIAHKEICREQKDNEKEIAEMEDELKSLQQRFIKTIGSSSPRKAEIRKETNPLNSDNWSKIKNKRAYRKELEEKRKEAAAKLAELKEAIAKLSPEKKPALESLLAPPQKYNLDECISQIEEIKPEPGKLQKAYLAAIESFQNTLPEIQVEPQFSESGILKGISIEPSLTYRFRNAPLEATSPGQAHGGAGMAASHYTSPVRAALGQARSSSDHTAAADTEASGKPAAAGASTASP